MTELTLELIQTRGDVSTANLTSLFLILIKHAKATNQQLEQIEARITKLENAN